MKSYDPNSRTVLSRGVVLLVIIYLSLRGCFIIFIMYKAVLNFKPEVEYSKHFKFFLTVYSVVQGSDQTFASG